MLVGETLAETTAPRPGSPDPGGLSQQQRRNLLVTLTAIASNLPDLDFLSSALSGDKLQYLLEHRGYTHTVIGAMFMAAVAYLLCEVWCRWRQWPLVARDRWQIAAAAALSLLLHIGMDFTNNYGVHPFWPFYNGWLYGDTIFIWEPLLWTAAAPLIFLLRTKVARALIGALLLAAVAACFGSGLVPTAFSVVMIALTLAMMIVGRICTRTTALMSAIAAWLMVTATFAVSRNAVESQVRRFASERLADATVLDYVLTPMPANPVCWDVMLPMVDANRYVIRHGTWSLWSAMLPAQECPGGKLFQDITAPMTAVSADQVAAVRWRGEVIMQRRAIADVTASYCQAAAFMRFARVPWVLERDSTWIVGDLRYDREPGLGFSELEVTSDAVNCPSALPPWLAPRSELLRQ